MVWCLAGGVLGVVSCSLRWGEAGVDPASRAVPALAGSLDRTNPAARLGVVRALAGFGLAGVAGLGVALTNQEAAVRQAARESLEGLGVETRAGAIIRGPKEQRRLALVFTGHEYAEGGSTILDELARHHGKGSFFLTGDFLRRREFAPLVGRLVGEGHYLGPHSDKHLLYCAWETPPRTRISRRDFAADLRRNLERAQRFLEHEGGRTQRIPFFLPAYEHYNEEIALWTRSLGLTLINFTPGTRSNADYTGEAERNFVSSQKIFESIIAKERQEPHGLNGYLLLLHIGAGPGRADKFHTRFGELLDYLAGKGYQFVRVDDLLRSPGDLGRAREAQPNSRL